MSQTTISPQQLQQRLESGETLELLDVRTPAEYQEIHLPAARNVPLDRLDVDAIKCGLTPGAQVYVICRSGSRGEMARQRLEKAGLANVLNVEGGTLACETAGLSVVRGRKVMSLERQVRIAAGAIVAAGSLLTIVHPWFMIVPLLVGCGLVFAGVTDTCAMGMLLSRMPWNQASSCTVAAAVPPAEPRRAA